MADTNVIQWDINDARISEAKEQFKNVDAYVDIDGAKAAKKTLTKMRTTLAEAHKEAKAEALEFGRRLDAEKNRLLEQITEIEDPITRQLDEIKNAAIRAEEARLSAIDDAIFEIQSYADDRRHSMTLDELKATRETVLALELDPDVFQEFADAAKLAKDEAALKLRLAIERETDRLKEEAENERVRLENEALKKQLAEAQAVADAQRKKEQAEREEAERKARAEHDAKMAKERAELAEKQAKIDAENARIEQERRERAEVEETQRQEEERLLRAPDVEKLEHYAVQVDQLIKAKPELTSDAGNDAMLQAISVLIEVAFEIRTAIEEMK